MTSQSEWFDEADVVIVGAGIVGLAHALDAVDRGLSVVVLERDHRAIGATVRNFGHGCTTAQAGPSLEYALEARETWLRVGKETGLWVREAGAMVLARHEDELAVLAEFAQIRGEDQAKLLTASQVAERVPANGDVVGGALLPMDVRVDQRRAPMIISDWLASRGVRFHWNTNAHGVEPGVVNSSRGKVRGRWIVVAAGHDVDRHFPDQAAQAEIRRCKLHMMRVDNPSGRTIEPAVLTGFSMLRYDGFGECPTIGAVRERLHARHPELVSIGLNLMYTQRPDGSLTIGDTHEYDLTQDPFDSEELNRLVLAATADLLGVPELTVRERWRGIYASAPEPFFISAPMPGVRAVSVTSGIGMTTAFGLAPRVLDDLLS
ncbi:TIGR03364 family FAD-dependent oxidoreductase [Pseudonocardiaceae bacterium YIM PH 21723]|nr:TIGR03364 family FAD-dependent oxidoreductase [Pseudonocardiaceae bacterium YIM PH 21723]